MKNIKKKQKITILNAFTIMKKNYGFYLKKKSINKKTLLH